MKKTIFIIISFLTIGRAQADEGMWIPSLIGKNYDEMVRLGLKLSKEDLYSINHSSLKDAVVQFNGICTGGMLSANGLLITNQHCVLNSVASLSTVEKNYLDDGFWSHNMTEELPAKDLSVLFLQRIDDVTDEVATAIGKRSGKAYYDKLDSVRKKIEERAAMSGKYVANVRDFFNNNQYLLLVYKKYADIRLVASPPKSLGQFGGVTEYWLWPRHNADFAIYRVYAGKDNEPAAYNLNNVPYQPAHFLPVSARGMNDGTSTWFGPGLRSIEGFI